MAQNVYLIQSAEDGPIGVAGNVAKAVGLAETYTGAEVRLANARHVLSHTGNYTVQGDSLTAYIHRFVMNALQTLPALSTIPAAPTAGETDEETDEETEEASPTPPVDEVTEVPGLSEDDEEAPEGEDEAPEEEDEFDAELAALEAEIEAEAARESASLMALRARQEAEDEFGSFEQLGA